MTETKPKSYTTRLIEFLEQNKVDKKTIDLIREFALEETEKREKEKQANKGIINFGKFKGKKLDEIFKLDPVYIKWLARNSQFLSEDNREIVKELLK